jgi:hypothetical protein
MTSEPGKDYAIVLWDWGDEALEATRTLLEKGLLKSYRENSIPRPKTVGELSKVD